MMTISDFWQTLEMLHIPNQTCTKTLKTHSNSISILSNPRIPSWQDSLNVTYSRKPSLPALIDILCFYFYIMHYMHLIHSIKQFIITHLYVYIFLNSEFSRKGPFSKYPHCLMHFLICSSPHWMFAEWINKRLAFVIMAFQLGPGKCAQSHSLWPWAPSIPTSDKLVQKAKDELGFLERPTAWESPPSTLRNVFYGSLF